MPLSLHAVIINSADGTGNTTAPVGDQGWNYVGSINQGSVTSSVTYVGNNWFITANHIKNLDNPTSINFDSNTYAISEWSSQISGADLIMFRVDGSIAVPDVSFYSGPLNSKSVTMIGNGRNRAIASTTWYVDTSTDPDTWSEIFSVGKVEIDGYKWASGSSKRWGTNTITATGVNVNTGHGTSDTFYTTFDTAGVDNEAQGATYDSGGGVFIQKGGNWELAGMMLAVGPLNGQPGSTSVDGNLTYIVNLSTYQAEIESILVIPELSSLCLMGLLLVVTVFAGYRRKKA